MIVKKKMGCYGIFCVAEHLAPLGPGGLGLENFFLDINEINFDIYNDLFLLSTIYTNFQGFS